MNALLAFPRAMLTMPKTWQAWIGLMLLLNAVVPLVYFGHTEGKVVFAVFVVSAVLMMAIHYAMGFVRLIGAGHFVWFPLIAWLVPRLDNVDDTVRLWLIALIAVNGISLIIDVIDVVRYLRGERDIPLAR